MSIVKDILTLMEKGFLPYRAKIPSDFYEKVKCRFPKKAEWFFRPWDKTRTQSRYICLGCRRRCVEVDPEGWQILLPVQLRLPSSVVLLPAMQVSADDLLRLRRVLRIHEACWVLGVKRSLLYEMVEDGRLDALEGMPLRVTVESVQRRLKALRC